MTDEQFRELLSVLRGLDSGDVDAITAVVSTLIGAVAGALLSGFVSSRAAKRTEASAQVAADRAEERSREAASRAEAVAREAAERKEVLAREAAIAERRQSVKRTLVAWSVDTAHGSRRREKSGQFTGETINDLRVALAMTGVANDALIGNDIDDLVRNWLERSSSRGGRDRYGKPSDNWTPADTEAVDESRRKMVAVLDRWIDESDSAVTVAHALASIAAELVVHPTAAPTNANGPDAARAEL